MRPETVDFLDKAQHCLGSAETISDVGLADVAAREAYLAAFHAAEAIIFERTGKAAKTHRGVRAQFSRLVQESGIAREFLTFLAEGYEFKTMADYGIGSAMDAISREDAISAVDTARRFIDAVTRLLSSTDKLG